MFIVREGYVLRIENYSEDEDEVTLWAGMPGVGRLVGRWIISEESPDDLADEVEEVRVRDKAINS